MTDHLDDPHGVFTLQRLESVKEQAIITFALLDYEQKEYPFKVSQDFMTLLVAGR